MTEKKPIGRPRLDASVKRLPSIGFRPTPHMRERLCEAAQRNKCSLTKEIERRLELSFRDDEVMRMLRHITADVQNIFDCVSHVDGETGE